MAPKAQCPGSIDRSPVSTKGIPEFKVAKTPFYGPNRYIPRFAKGDMLHLSPWVADFATLASGDSDQSPGFSTRSRDCAP